MDELGILHTMRAAIQVDYEAAIPAHVSGMVHGCYNELEEEIHTLLEKQIAEIHELLVKYNYPATNLDSLM